jgi:cell division septal protein FtsQ
MFQVFISLILKSLLAVAGKALLALGTESMIKYGLFKIADVVVKSTKTKHDDEFLEKLKADYAEKE